ncbi:SDR family NAD(P)-dependent oxidoreductase [Virgibacillus xinjiangensis]|uniref:SDR family NAD(P)-dependent oxidoreductase n=1 Tax=Virgibacillus xinjiangensis TaxID=393090 RepID=A0ABV7CZH1_9BACI
MEVDLAGKNILVTGSAKGIGRQIALAAGKNGANVAVHYHTSIKEANETADEISSYGVESAVVQADISDFRQVERAKKELNQKLGAIHGIVNNAGMAQVKTFFHYEPEEWKREVDVCLHSVMNLAYLFIPDMREAGQGKMVNIVGDSARTGDKNLIVSGAARNGAISFMKSLAIETGKYNIQCNSMALGMIDQGDLDDEIKGKLMRQYPSRKLGSSEDVAEMAMFLLSSSADWITGQVMAVNGGYSMLG